MWKSFAKKMHKGRGYLPFPPSHQEEMDEESSFNLDWKFVQKLALELGF